MWFQGDFKSQKEAAWAVTNFTSGGTAAQLGQLVEMGALEPMCNLLNSKDSKTIIVVLEGLNNILGAAAKVDQAEKVAVMIEECGGLDGIEALQSHDNEKVYERALHIIENYFAEVGFLTWFVAFFIYLFIVGRRGSRDC